MTHTSKGVVKASFENDKHSMLLSCRFQKNGVYALESTTRKTNSHTREQNDFISSFSTYAREIMVKAKSFQKVSDWHELSPRAQHVVARDDWLLPFGVYLANRQMKMSDLWVACNASRAPDLHVELALCPDHPDYTESLEEPHGSRGRITLDRGPRGRLKVRPFYDGANTVQNAIQRNLGHIIDKYDFL